MAAIIKAVAASYQNEERKQVLMQTLEIACVALACMSMITLFQFA